MADLVENLKRVMADRNIGAIKLAQMAGLGRSAVSDILTGKSGSPRLNTLQAIAESLDLSVDDLTTGGGSSQMSARATDSTGKTDMPVYASGLNGKDGMTIRMDVIEHTRRPDFLEGIPDAFAFYVVEESMEPRFECGERLLVHPRRPPRAGSDVLILFKSTGGADIPAMVKRLVSVSRDVVRVRQYNPAREFDIDRKAVENMYKIMGVQTVD